MTDRLAYSISEVADAFGVARVAVMRLVATGRLPVLFIGTETRIPASVVMDFIRDNARPMKKKSRPVCRPDGSHYTPERTR